VDDVLLVQLNGKIFYLISVVTFPRHSHGYYIPSGFVYSYAFKGTSSAVPSSTKTWDGASNIGGPENLFEIWRIWMRILRGSDLKQNIEDNVDIFLQNTPKLTSIVAFCPTLQL